MFVLFKRWFNLMFLSGSHARFQWRLYRREFKYMSQRWSRGFDDSELWNLDLTIAEFVLPRLKAFSEYNSSHPASLTEEQWKEALNKMARAFELCVDDKNDHYFGEDEFIEGMKLFVEYYSHLWD